MINSFISLVVNDILKNADSTLRETAVIFPNRRAGGMFRQELINQVKVSSWSPGIFSIDDWLVNLSGLKKTDKFEELVLLYPIVKDLIEHINSFADFIDLGETLLADFDDTDKYLANTSSLFTTLKEVKKIDSQFDITSDEQLVERIRVFWKSFGTNRSVHQEKWLEIWDKILPIYENYIKKMIDRGLGTSGMCYRKAAEDLITGKATPGGYKKFAFVGFNILTIAEEKIFLNLKERGLACFYWDYHPFYMESPHEAGKFMQNYLKIFPPPTGFQPFPDGTRAFFGSNDPKEVVTVIPTTSNTGQVQALLKDLLDRPSSRRGIILADEGLFSDLLSSWPEVLLPVNFTSGFPMRDTQAAGLFHNLVDLFVEYNKGIEGNSFKSELVIAFLRHPWTKWLTGEHPDSLIKEVQRRFHEFVPAEFVNSNALTSSLMGSVVTDLDILERLQTVGGRLLEFKELYYPIEAAAINSIIEEIELLKRIIVKHQVTLDAKSLSKLFFQFLNTFKITLETERDAPNQVTGILETRLVDFEEVFILSFNEGIWPSKSLPGSLIPYSIRKIFHLPTAENRDAMYAYYFYRLVQRTKSLNIYYLTGHRDDAIRSGERSRYITQLQFEIPTRIEFRTEPPARVGAVAQPIIIKKEGLVIERLYRYLSGSDSGKFLSPSAINEYMDCSLRFALKRIYEIKEPDEIAYASEPKGFGILIHQVMNRLYQHLVGINHGVNIQWLTQVIEDKEKLSAIILEEYNSLLKETGLLSPGGKELLAMEVVRQFLTRILDFDRRLLPERILALEEKYFLDFPVDIGVMGALVHLSGIIDRIDRVEDGIRIIDYKTGNCELNIKTIEDVFNRNSTKRPKEIFQVMLYCELFLHQNEGVSDLLPCLFRLGRFRSGDYENRIRLSSKDFAYSSVREEFLIGLKIILEELFNPEIPFVQTENEQKCKYCSYSGLCSRDDHS
jgi:hypothetical protein